jgi:hypothetical protein
LGLSSLIAAGGWPVGILILFGVLIMLRNVAEIFPSLRSSSSDPTVPLRSPLQGPGTSFHHPNRILA